MRRLFYMVTFLALVQPTLAQTVLESDFTISVPRPAGQDDLVESTTLVPLLDGTCYNWHLRLGKVKGAVTITELYTLPAAPATWGVSEDGIVVADDKLSATSTLTLTPEDGWIWSGWCVSDGDPEGPYQFIIKSGDKLLHTFKFELRSM